MELNRKQMRKIAILITFTVLLLVAALHYKEILSALSVVWAIILPFVTGAAIAFILNIPMTFIEKGWKQIFGGEAYKENPPAGRVKSFFFRIARPVSMVLAICFVLLIIILVCWVVIPQLGATIESVRVSIINFVPTARSWIEELLAGQPELVRQLESIQIDWGSYVESVRSLLVDWSGNIVSYTVSATVSIISGVTTTLIAFIFACYILAQKEKLSAQFVRVFRVVFKPDAVEKILGVCTLAYTTFSRFITGQCLEAMILGCMFWVSMMVLGLPYPLLVGVLIAFMALIPIVGAFIGCFVGTFLILMVNPLQALIFVILFLILQQIEGNLIYPHVVGSSVGLPSIWVLVAVTVGGNLMGIVGMLIFIPLTSVVYAMFRGWVVSREQKIS